MKGATATAEPSEKNSRSEVSRALSRGAKTEEIAILAYPRQKNMQGTTRFKREKGLSY